jgi:hypothetical protein
VEEIRQDKGEASSSEQADAYTYMPLYSLSQSSRSADSTVVDIDVDPDTG